MHFDPLTNFTTKKTTTEVPSYCYHSEWNISTCRSMYLCAHSCTDSKGANATEVYLWSGQGVAEPTMEDVQIFARNLAKQNPERGYRDSLRKALLQRKEACSSPLHPHMVRTHETGPTGFTTRVATRETPCPTTARKHSSIGKERVLYTIGKVNLYYPKYTELFGMGTPCRTATSYRVTDVAVAQHQASQSQADLRHASSRATDLRRQAALNSSGVVETLVNTMCGLASSCQSCIQTGRMSLQEECDKCQRGSKGLPGLYSKILGLIGKFRRRWIRGRPRRRSLRR
ncbi:hypothetical protein P280DRAFT_230407 [Massarina eburnea CBS 473.64]|uniref:DUF7904 domain-containing protein n=1 Tax=Massarina eburnea CBS 473.64 TaxID=1395130 RepID=A0A6A6SD57_9PLEO|nr:hypothetical protein P280DRAFT_230407 [Massarina eburnea CBS 473.64]